MVSGEISTQTYIDIPRVVRDVVKDVGYTHSSYGFDYETCS
jgi:S-adenosylmethionine synthetase